MVPLRFFAVSWCGSVTCGIPSFQRSSGTVHVATLKAFCTVAALQITNIVVSLV